MLSRSRHIALAIVATLALVLPLATPAAPVARAAQQPSTFPLTITDDRGVSSTFSRPPQRVISLTPSLTEITFALGAGNRLVAVDRYSEYPPEAKDIQPRLVTYPRPSIETIVSLKPDLVLCLTERDEDIALLQAQGIKVLKFLPRDLDAVLRTMVMLGQLFDAAPAAEAITTDMSMRRDAVVEAVAGTPRPRVYEELDASDVTKPFVAGPSGFYGQLIELAGGENIFADLPSDFGQVGAESIIERDPEIIILTDADLPFNSQTPEMVAARAGWDAITAVQKNAIYAVPAELYATFGPRLILGLEELATRLHPDRFPPPVSFPSGPMGKGAGVKEVLSPAI
jgi:iron complex transport system substrate-binding protein